MFFTILLWSSLVSDGFVLNPRNADISAANAQAIPKEEETKWLKEIYGRMSLISPTDSKHIQDDAGETLETKIQKASEAYLQLNIEESDALSGDAYALLAKTLPYPKMTDDLVLLATLKAMIAERTAEQEKKSKIALSAEALPFYSDKQFQSKVPIKVFNRLEEPRNETFSISTVDFSDDLRKLYLSGKEVKLPIRLNRGRYLMHALENDKVSIGWLNVGEKIQLERLRERSLWTAVPIKNLKEAFEATRPFKYSQANLSVMTENNSGEFTPLLIVSKKSVKPGNISQTGSTDHSNGGLMAVDIFKSKNDVFAFETMGDNWKEIDESPSIFKNPWFWLGVGAIAGTAGGFVIYETTKTKTVTTP